MVVSFTSSPSTFQGPRCPDGTPAAWLRPRRADSSPLPQTALGADRGKSQQEWHCGAVRAGLRALG